MLSSAPGQGKSTLAAQLAGAAAVSGRSTHLHCVRETPRACAARLVASLGLVPYHELLDGQPLDGIAARRAERARLRLSAAELDVDAGGGPSGLEAAAAAEVVIVDEAHLYPPGTPARLREISGAGAIVIATVPEDLLCHGEIGAGTTLRREWADVCDLAVGLRWPRGDGVDREGEVDLFVMKNRHGPLLRDVVAFDGVYARFSDLEPG
jgi:replicative DNA helicase